MPFDKIYWLEDWKGKAQGGFYYRDDFFKAIKKFEQEFKKKVVGIRIEDGWNIEFIVEDDSPRENNGDTHGTPVELPKICEDSVHDTESKATTVDNAPSTQKNLDSGEVTDDGAVKPEHIQSRELSEGFKYSIFPSDKPDICKCGKEIYFLDGVWWHSGTDRVYCHRNTVAEPQDTNYMGLLGVAWIGFGIFCLFSLILIVAGGT